MPEMQYVMGVLVPMAPREAAEWGEVQAAISVPRMIAKSDIINRLIDAGLIGAAKAALDADPSAFARWFSPDRPSIAADDPEALAFLQAIGADPAVILA